MAGNRKMITPSNRFYILGKRNFFPLSEPSSLKAHLVLQCKPQRMIWDRLLNTRKYSHDSPFALRSVWRNVVYFSQEVLYMWLAAKGAGVCRSCYSTWMSSNSTPPPPPASILTSWFDPSVDLRLGTCPCVPSGVTFTHDKYFHFPSWWWEVSDFC